MAVEVSPLARAGAAWEQRWGRECRWLPSGAWVLCTASEQGCVCVHAHAGVGARLLGACLPWARVIGQAPCFLLTFEKACLCSLTFQKSKSCWGFRNVISGFLPMLIIYLSQNPTSVGVPFGELGAAPAQRSSVSLVTGTSRAGIWL